MMISYAAFFIIFPVSVLFTILFLEYFFPDGGPNRLESWLKRRRSEKFTEILGKRFHTKVISQYLNDRFELIGERKDYEELLRRIGVKLESLLRDGGRLQHEVLSSLIEGPDSRHDLIRHKEAAVLYLLFNLHRPVIRSQELIKRRPVKVFIIADVARGKRVHLAVDRDFLPIEDLTVEFPLHEERVPLVQKITDCGDHGATNN